MNRAAVLVAVGAAALASAPPAAHANHVVADVAVPYVATYDGSSSAAGATCGMVTTTDATSEPLTRSGVVSAGPVAAFADVLGNPVTVTIECSIQVTAAFHHTPGWVSEDANDAYPSQSVTGAGVATLPPTQVSYQADSSIDTTYLCTEWTLVNAHGVAETVYLDDEEAGGSGQFVTDPTTARCAVAETFDSVEEGVTPVLCPLLALVFPPDGDVVVAGITIVDCQPAAGTP